MSATPVSAPRAHAGRGARLLQQARFVRVIAGSQFKLKYADSVLGYAWSLLKPLALFSVLYVVFGRLFRLGTVFSEYPVFLLLGLVLWIYFQDATASTMVSVVASPLLRKLSFPRIVIPVSATMTSTVTLGINLVAVVVFVAWSGLVPELDWLLLIPLFVELYLVVLGISLVLATLFVRFRDVAQIWELSAQILFYATPVIYPMGIFPDWAQGIVLLNPFAQLLQDIRSVMLGPVDPGGYLLTASDVLGPAGHAYPLAICLLILVAGVLIFRREESGFAERI